MKTLLLNTSAGEKTVVAIIAIVGFLFATYVLALFALTALAKVVVIFVVPGVVYLPVRLLVGASLLPKQSPILVQLGSKNSRFDFLLAALFMALLQGYAAVLIALFILGCVVTPIGLLESFLSIKLMPPWVGEIIWPIIGAAFAAGVAWAAIQDVKAERSGQ